MGQFTALKAIVAGSLQIQWVCLHCNENLPVGPCQLTRTHGARAAGLFHYSVDVGAQAGVNT